MADVEGVERCAGEHDRMVALTRAGILDTAPEPQFDAIVELVRAICEVPIALVSLVDRDRQWFKARAGLDAQETSLDTSVCALTSEANGLFVIPDLAADPRTAAFSLVTQAPHLRFYAGFPLLTPDGVPIGALCALDTRPRPAGLTETQAIALEALARQTGLEIGRRELALGMAAGVAGAASVGAWDWDIASGRVVCNATFARLYGIDPAQAAVGAPAADFLPAVHPDDLPGLRVAIGAAREGAGEFTHEYRVLPPGGGARWMLVQGRYICGPDGAAVRASGISFDINERKSAERRLAALVRLGDRLDRPGDAGELARAACEILGTALDAIRVGYGLVDAEKETIVTGQDWVAPGFASFSGTLAFRDYGSFIDDLLRGEAVVIDDVSVDPRTAPQAAAAQALHVHALINLPIVEKGALVALLFVNDAQPRRWNEEDVAFVREVAERTRAAVERRRVEGELAELTTSLEDQVAARTRDLLAAEEDLRQAQKMEAVGQLTGGIAHDFNNLLTGISGALEMIGVRVAQGRTGELDRYVSAAQGAASRAAALTHRLLAFSRRQTLDPKPVDVNRLVTGLEELVRRTVGPAIAVDVVGADDLWPALVDPNQLENALLNLCINARDAMPDGGRITIETANEAIDDDLTRERDLSPGQYLSLCVADTGTGMSEEVQARAFDPFYTTKPLGEGTGLGLSMIYGFARQSGGQVRIDSKEGQGTRMCIFLPRHHGALDHAAAGAPRPQAPRDDGRRVVLVVDDEPTIRMLVVEMLEELGFTVLEAGDGAEALRVAADAPAIDLLVTDVGLPGGLNGRQVADAVLARAPATKVLFITGYAEHAAIDGRLAPGVAVVTKPFAMDLFAEKVGELLAG